MVRNLSKFCRKFIIFIVVFSLVLTMHSANLLVLFATQLPVSFTLGTGITAVLDEGGTLVVSGTGDMYDYSKEELPPFYDIRENIKNVKIEGGITSIGNYVFYNCQNISGELIIPATVIRIGDYAFSGDKLELSPRFLTIINDMIQAEIVVPTKPDDEIKPEIEDPKVDEEEPSTSLPPVDNDLGPENDTGVDSELGTDNNPGETDTADKPDDSTANTDTTDKPDDSAANTDTTDKPDDSTANTDTTDKPDDSITSTDAANKPSDPGNGTELTLLDDGFGADAKAIGVAPADDQMTKDYEIKTIMEQEIGTDIFMPGQVGTYRCSDTNTTFKVAVEAGGYIPKDKFAIVSQSQDSMENAGGDISFSIWATSENDEFIAYQWEKSLLNTDQEEKWELIEGKTTQVLTMNSKEVGFGILDYKYRCKITWQDQVLYSNNVRVVTNNVSTVNVHYSPGVGSGTVITKPVYEASILLDELPVSFLPPKGDEVVTYKFAGWTTDDGPSLYAPNTYLNVTDSQNDIYLTASWQPEPTTLSVLDKWDGMADTSWYVTDKTTFELTSPSQLAGLSAIVNGDGLDNDGKVLRDNFLGKTIYLNQTIVLNDGEDKKTWTPIGSVEYPFAGTFDGRGFVINGLNIYDTTLDNQGLFGVIDGGVVKNLGMTDVDIAAGNYVGGIAATAKGKSSILNCYIYGNLKGGTVVGSVVGNLLEGNIKNCYTTSTITADTVGGGLTGHVSATGNVSNSYYLKNGSILSSGNGTSPGNGYFMETSGQLICEEGELAFGNDLLTALNQCAISMNGENDVVLYDSWQTTGDGQTYPVLSINNRKTPKEVSVAISKSKGIKAGRQFQNNMESNIKTRAVTSGYVTAMYQNQYKATEGVSHVIKFSDPLPKGASIIMTNIIGDSQPTYYYYIEESGETPVVSFSQFTKMGSKEERYVEKVGADMEETVLLTMNFSNCVILPSAGTSLDMWLYIGTELTGTELTGTELTGTELNGIEDDIWKLTCEFESESELTLNDITINQQGEKIQLSGTGQLNKELGENSNYIGKESVLALAVTKDGVNYPISAINEGLSYPSVGNITSVPIVLGQPFFVDILADANIASGTYNVTVTLCMTNSVSYPLDQMIVSQSLPLVIEDTSTNETAYGFDVSALDGNHSISLKNSGEVITDFQGDYVVKNSDLNGFYFDMQVFKKESGAYVEDNTGWELISETLPEPVAGNLSGSSQIKVKTVPTILETGETAKTYRLVFLLKDKSGKKCAKTVYNIIVSKD